MAEAALKEDPREPAMVRRFERADLSKHGPWLLKRFQLRFPAFGEKEIAGYLAGLINSNEQLFLYLDHAVALAQVSYSAGIRPAPVLQERFVWVEDKNSKAQLEDAADFYSEFKLWAQRKGIERMFVCEDTDVPKPLIEARLGARIFDTKISHVRV